MPGQNQGESFVLKHRLAGAAVLIAFAVIVLPILLGGPREEQNSPDDATASRESDTKVFRSNITPIGGATPNTGPRDVEGLDRAAGEPLNQDAPPPGGGAPSEEPRAAGAGDDDGARAAGSGQADEADQAAAGAPHVASRGEEGGDAEPAESEDAGEPREIERGWIVQVGTFKKRSNVDKLVSELENSGFGASTTDVDTLDASATRVWVGPFETRVEAARVKTRVTQQVGSEALIVAYP